MRKINYLVLNNSKDLQMLIVSNIVSSFPCGDKKLIVAAKGVNKTSLKKISKEISAIDNK